MVNLFSPRNVNYSPIRYGTAIILYDLLLV